MSALCLYSPQVPKKTINECNLSMCAGSLVKLKQEKKIKSLKCWPCGRHPDTNTPVEAVPYWSVANQSDALCTAPFVYLVDLVQVVDTFITVASLSETVSVFKRRNGEEGMSGVWHRGRGVLIVTRTSAQSRIKKRHPVGVYFWPCAQERTCSHFYSCMLFRSFAKEKHNDVFSHRAKAAYCVRTTLRLL